MKFVAQPIKALLVGENPAVLTRIRERLSRHFSVVVDETVSIREASSKTREQRLDVVIWSHSDWEEGANLYCEILEEQKSPPRLVMFMDDPSILKPELDGYFVAIHNDDYDGLVDAVDWLVVQSRGYG